MPNPTRQILPPPPKASTKWQRPVLGGPVGRFADTALHLAGARYRKVSHHSITYPRTTAGDATFLLGMDYREPASVRALEIPFRPSVMGRYIGLIMEVTPKDTGAASITVELRTFGNASVLIDAGCVWSQLNGQIIINDRAGSYPRSTLTTGVICSGGVAPVGFPTNPRCLFVPDDASPVSPPNYRGEKCMLKVLCVDIDPYSLDIFEMFEGDIS